MTGIDNQAKVLAALRTGEGVALSDRATGMACATAKLFRAGSKATRAQGWLPGLDGVADRLPEGGRTLDNGCGRGFYAPISWRAPSRTRIVGGDFHAPRLQTTMRRPAGCRTCGTRPRRRRTSRPRPRLRDSLGSLRDMGDPAGAAAHVRQGLKPGGTG